MSNASIIREWDRLTQYVSDEKKRLFDEFDYDRISRREYTSKLKELHSMLEDFRKKNFKKKK